MNTPSGQLTIKDIAALTDKTPAAVSNWRARHDDFPQPVADSPARRPRFDYDEVKTWLAGRDLLPDDFAAKRERVGLAAAFNSLRSVFELNLQTATVLLYLLEARRRDYWATIAQCQDRASLSEALANVTWSSELTPFSKTSLDHYIQAAGDDKWVTALLHGLDSVDFTDYAAACDFILEACVGLGGRGSLSMYGSPESTQTQLLANAAETSIKPNTTVLDTACGLAGTLLKLAKAEPSAHLHGVDISNDAITAARLNAALHEVDAILETANSISDELSQDVQADLVVIEPPFGMRVRPDECSTLLTSVGLSSSPTLHSEEVFLLSALAHLAPGGHAYVLTPLGAGSRHTSAQLRQQLVARGSVEAIIQLPPKLLAYTSIPSMLWVLRNDPEAADEVWVADATNEDNPVENIGEWVTALRNGAAVSIPARKLSLAEIVTNDSELLPEKYFREEIAASDARDNFVASEKALENSLSQLSALMLPKGNVPLAEETLTLKDLQERGDVEIVRGHSTTTDQGADGAELHLVTGTRAGSGRTVKETPRTVRVHKGDVVVPNSSNIPAFVFDEDGDDWAAASTVTLIRSNTFDADFLAVSINASFNEHAALGSSVHMKTRRVREIEIPQLGSDEQKRIGEASKQLNEIIAQTQQLQQHASNYRNAMLDIVRFGAH